MKLDIASTGIIVVIYFTTSSSLLYKQPQTLRTKIVIKPIAAPTATVMTNVTYTAKRAACGCPPPNSFETLVLIRRKIQLVKVKEDPRMQLDVQQNCKFLEERMVWRVARGMENHICGNFFSKLSPLCL